MNKGNQGSIEIGEIKNPGMAASFYSKYGPKTKLLTKAKYDAFLAGAQWQLELTLPQGEEVASNIQLDLDAAQSLAIERYDEIQALEEKIKQLEDKIIHLEGLLRT